MIVEKLNIEKDFDEYIEKMKEFKIELNSIMDTKYSAFRGELKSDEELKQITLNYLNDKKSIILVGKVDGKIVGMGSGDIRIIHSESHGGYYYGGLDDLWVQKDFRGKGYSKIIISEVEKFFRENKCKYTKLSVMNTNPAKEAYKKMGFDEYMTLMKRVLD